MHECCTHSIKSSPCLSDDCPVISSNINTPSWNITFPHSSSAHDPTHPFLRQWIKRQKSIDLAKKKKIQVLPFEQESLIALGWLCGCLLTRISEICKRKISVIDNRFICIKLCILELTLGVKFSSNMMLHEFTETSYVFASLLLKISKYSCG